MHSVRSSIVAVTLASVSEQRLLYFSKIKLVGYHQWRVLIGWATRRPSLTSKSVNKQVTAESLFAEDHSVFTESKLITHFRTLRFPANKRRTRELDNWKKKNCPNSAPERSSTESRPLLQRCFGSIRTELNCQTSSFLDFPLKVYSASLRFCKICLMKGHHNCHGVSLLWIVHRKSSQEQNNKRRLQVGLGVTELLNV